jgi:hypothetical protein
VAGVEPGQIQQLAEQRFERVDAGEDPVHHAALW